MGWSVYVLDNVNKLGFEIGEKWASGFPVEAVLTKESMVAELRRRLAERSEDAIDELAQNVFLVAQHAGFDVRIAEGQELPEGFRYVGGFWNGVLW
jgi:hypothetical protein